MNCEEKTMSSCATCYSSLLVFSLSHQFATSMRSIPHFSYVVTPISALVLHLPHQTGDIVDCIPMVTCQLASHG